MRVFETDAPDQPFQACISAGLREAWGEASGDLADAGASPTHNSPEFLRHVVKAAAVLLLKGSISDRAAEVAEIETGGNERLASFFDGPS